MSDDKNNGSGFKTLDLDELLGQAKPIRVKWDGKTHDLIGADGISPKQAVQLQSMQARVWKLTDGTKTDVTDADAAALESVVDEMLGMLCNDLPLDTIPFGSKLKIITFYVAETQGKNAQDAAVETPIGAASLPS